MYGNVEDLKIVTGIKPEELKLHGVEELDGFLERLLVDITDIINVDRARDYEAEVTAGTLAAVPGGINRIAISIAVNQIRQMQATRSSAIVQINEFSARVLDDSVLTPGNKRDLARYPRGQHFGLVRVRNQAEIEADAAAAAEDDADS